MIEGKTGIFFEEQTENSLIEAIKRFEEIRYELNPNIARSNAMRFSNERFLSEFVQFVQSSLKGQKLELDSPTR